VPSTF